jgi:hypothetical protein
MAPISARDVSLHWEFVEFQILPALPACNCASMLRGNTVSAHTTRNKTPPLPGLLKLYCNHKT